MNQDYLITFGTNEKDKITMLENGNNIIEILQKLQKEGYDLSNISEIRKDFWKVAIEQILNNCKELNIKVRTQKYWHQLETGDLELIIIPYKQTNKSKIDRNKHL